MQRHNVRNTEMLDEIKYTDLFFTLLYPFSSFIIVALGYYIMFIRYLSYICSLP